MIESIRQKLARGQMEYSLHAVRQMVARSITPDDVAEAIRVGEVIEDYPEDKYVRVVWRWAAQRREDRCTFNARTQAVRW